MTLRIDAHVHVFAKACAEFPRQTNDRLPADREEPVEKLLKVMEANRVDQAVLVQIGGTSLEHHAYLCHCLKAYPGRFLGIGLIPANHPSPEAHMDRLAADGNIIGFRLSSIGGPADPLALMDIRTFATYPIWQHAAKKNYVLWLYPRAVDAHTVPFLIDAFPQIRVVFNHMLACPGKGSFSWDEKGRPHVEFSNFPPQTRYATFGLHQYQNVHVHLSGQYAFSKEAWPHRDLTEWHERLYAPKTRIQGFGADRLMWATDFPWIVEDPGYDKMTQIVQELLPDLPENERAEIMGETAKRVLRFPDLPG
jgi:predicted TIM-barrel fold metal-dependent hydrolase